MLRPPFCAFGPSFLSGVTAHPGSHRKRTERRRRTDRWAVTTFQIVPHVAIPANREGTNITLLCVVLWLFAVITAGPLWLDICLCFCIRRNKLNSECAGAANDSAGVSVNVRNLASTFSVETNFQALLNVSCCKETGS